MRRKAGFSLFELVIALAIAGIVAAVAGMVVVSAVTSYVFTRETAKYTQKAEMALLRLRVELTNMTAVTAATANSLKFANTRGSVTPDVNRSLTIVSDKIKIIDGTNLPAAGTGKVLLDNVSAFILNYYKTGDDLAGAGTWLVADGIYNLFAIKVTLTTDHVDPDIAPKTYTVVINLRRSGRYNAPYGWNS